MDRLYMNQVFISTSRRSFRPVVDQLPGHSNRSKSPCGILAEVYHEYQLAHY